MRLSFLGLGAMGYPMAGHLARQGHSVTVWNRTTAVAFKHAAEHGSEVASELASASKVELLFSCLPTSDVVDEIVDAIIDQLAEGTIWVDCTSGAPETSAATAARLAARGVQFLDAPVSGGVGGAVAGTLTVMVGGSPSALEGAREAIAAFASNIFHIGPAGSGHALKAINNTLLAVHILAAAEGLVALERLGIAPTRALEVLNTATGRSFVSERLLPGPLASGTFPTTFKLGLLDKDVRIGAGVIAPIPGATLAAAAQALVSKARLSFGPDVDYLQLVRLFAADPTQASASS